MHMGIPKMTIIAKMVPVRCFSMFSRHAKCGENGVMNSLKAIIVQERYTGLGEEEYPVFSEYI